MSSSPRTEQDCATSSHEDVPEPFNGESLPPDSEIHKFLDVANLIQVEEPRAAFLCRLHAFEIAQNRDPYFTDRDVKHFKTALLRRLDQDEEPSRNKRQEPTDKRELKRVYSRYANISGQADVNDRGREELASARRVASAIWDVIQTVKRAAIEWAIQRMEVVRIDEKSRSESCAICLEGFGEDEEETRRTACSHVFHGRCVADWLRIKNLCPLCRFQLWGDWR